MKHDNYDFEHNFSSELGKNRYGSTTIQNENSWEESKHPRSESGQFGAGGSGEKKARIDGPATRLKKALKDPSKKFDKELHEKLKKELETEKDPEMREALKKEIKRQLTLK